MKIINALKRKYENLSENSRIVVGNVIGAFSIKGLSLCISFFTMPAYMHFFRNETALGVWFTVLSVLNWILTFDLGIGNGLRNHLAASIAEKKYDDSKKYLSSAYFSIGIACLIFICAFWFLFDFVNWNYVFNIKEEIVSAHIMCLTVKITFLGIVGQMFFKLITSVLYAMQRSSINNLLTLCTSIFTLIMVLVLPSQSNDENMICMAIIHVIAVIAPLCIATIVVFSKTQLKAIRPNLKSISYFHTKAVLSLGGIFFFVQIVYMIIMNTNDYLITFLSGGENVVEYQIYYKLFVLGSTIFSLALTPIWSSVTKAIAEKNTEWINLLYRKLWLFAMGGCICEFLLILFLQPAINLWLQEMSIEVNYVHAVTFATMGSLMIINAVLSSIANGMGALGTQVICFSIGAVVKIPLSMWLVTISNDWSGVVIANIIALLIYCIVQPITLNRRLNQMKQNI